LHGIVHEAHPQLHDEPRFFFLTISTTAKISTAATKSAAAIS